MSTHAEASETYPSAVISQLEGLNGQLTRLRIYAVSEGLDDITVWPADYLPPPEAKRASQGEDEQAIIGLRIADRFVWLGEREATVLLQALEVSGAAARVLGPTRDHREAPLVSN